MRLRRYKQSGNGREYADGAILEFLETKGIVVTEPPEARPPYAPERGI